MPLTSGLLECWWWLSVVQAGWWGQHLGLCTFAPHPLSAQGLFWFGALHVAHPARGHWGTGQPSHHATLGGGMAPSTWAWWPTSAPPCALRGTGGTNGTPCRGPTWSTRGASHCCRTAARSGYYYGGVVVCLAQKRPRCASKCCDRRALHQATKVPPCAHAAHPTKTDEPTMVVPI